MAEWLSSGKHNRVYLPEEPFLHGSLIRSGRLKSFQHLHVRICNKKKQENKSHASFVISIYIYIFFFGFEL